MIGMGKPPSPPPGDNEAMPPGGPDDEDTEAAGKNYEIDAPDGFQPPDDVQEGDEFDATIRGHMENGGKTLCIDSVNGIKTGDSEQNEGDETDKAAAPPEQSMDEAMMAQRRMPANG